MKKLLLTGCGLLLINQLVAAQTGELKLTCNEGNWAGFYYHPGDELSETGSVYYNFSSASVICPDHHELKRRVLAGEDFTCAGLWAYDRKDGVSVDTPAIFEAKFEGDRYKGYFKSNHVYGRVDVEVECEVTFE